MIPLKNPDWPDWPWRGVACGSQRRFGRLQAPQSVAAPAFAVNGFSAGVRLIRELKKNLESRARVPIAPFLIS